VHREERAALRWIRKAEPEERTRDALPDEERVDVGGIAPEPTT